MPLKLEWRGLSKHVVVWDNIYRKQREISTLLIPNFTFNFSSLFHPGKSAFCVNSHHSVCQWLQTLLASCCSAIDCLLQESERVWSETTFIITMFTFPCPYGEGCLHNLIRTLNFAMVTKEKIIIGEIITCPPGFWLTQGLCGWWGQSLGSQARDCGYFSMQQGVICSGVSSPPPRKGCRPQDNVVLL